MLDHEHFWFWAGRKIGKEPATRARSIVLLREYLALIPPERHEKLVARLPAWLRESAAPEEVK